MYLLHSFTRLISRFRYPASLPEDIAKDLGIHLSNSLSFDAFLKLLSSPHMHPTKIKKYMPRAQAESAFSSALRTEVFPACSLFSYYFSKGWVVIALHFDEEERLRRAYFQCPSCEEMEGFNFLLEMEEPLLARASSQ